MPATYISTLNGVDGQIYFELKFSKLLEYIDVLDMCNYEMWRFKKYLLTYLLKLYHA